MTFFSKDPVEESKIIKRAVEPAPVPESLQDRQTRGTYNLITKLWHWLRGYTASDIDRLKKAAVRQVELTAEVKAADALQKLSEAERNFAEAEKIRGEAAINHALGEMEAEALRMKAQAEAEALRMKAQAEAEALRLQTIADAMERLINAISHVRQKGGDISLDIKQLEIFIRRGLTRYPDDSSLQDAAGQLPEGLEE